MAFEIRYHNANSLQRRYPIRHWIPMFFGTPCRTLKSYPVSSLLYTFEKTPIYQIIVLILTKLSNFDWAKYWLNNSNFWR